MNRYYCAKCNAESVIYSHEPELAASCKCAQEPTLHRLVSLKGKPTPPVTKLVKPVEVEVIPPSPAPKPTTKLDVSSGPIGATKTK